MAASSSSLLENKPTYFNAYTHNLEKSGAIPDSNMFFVWLMEKNTRKHSIKVFSAPNSKECTQVTEYIFETEVSDILPINSTYILCTNSEYIPDTYFLLELNGKVLQLAVDQPNLDAHQPELIFVLNQEYIATSDLNRTIVCLFNTAKNFQKVGEISIYDELRHGKEGRHLYAIKQMTMTSTGDLAILYQNGEMHLFNRKSNGEGFETISTMHQHPLLAELHDCRLFPSPTNLNELIILGASLIPVPIPKERLVLQIRRYPKKNPKIYRYNLNTGELQSCLSPDSANENRATAISCICTYAFSDKKISLMLRMFNILIGDLIRSPDNSVLYSSVNFSNEGQPYFYTMQTTTGEVIKEVLEFTPAKNLKPAFLISTGNGLLVAVYHGQFIIRKTDYYKMQQEVVTEISTINQNLLPPPVAKIIASYCSSESFFAPKPIVKTPPVAVMAQESKEKKTL